jgi:hypothetical protein
MITASFLAIGGPLIYLIPSYLNEAYNLKLNSENKSLAVDVAKYKKILSAKQVIIKTETKKLKNLQKIFESKAKTLTSIHTKKVNYNFKSDFLHTFAKDLKKHEVHVERIVSNEDEFTLHLLSSDEKQITKYIKYISKEYSFHIQTIDIKRIEIDDKDKLYRGILKVNYK